MAKKPSGNLTNDINKLVKPPPNYQTLNVKAERVAIGQARGSGKASENAVGGGDGEEGEYITTDGLFTLVIS